MNGKEKDNLRLFSVYVYADDLEFSLDWVNEEIIISKYMIVRKS